MANHGSLLNLDLQHENINYNSNNDSYINIDRNRIIVYGFFIGNTNVEALSLKGDLSSKNVFSCLKLKVKGPTDKATKSEKIFCFNKYLKHRGF